MSKPRSASGPVRVVIDQDQLLHGIPHAPGELGLKQGFDPPGRAAVEPGQPVEQFGVGLVISSVAAVINLVVGLLLVRKGGEHRSITLEADGKHLLTDVWTSVGVLVGVGIVALTGWNVLDPVVAMVVGLNILVTGFSCQETRSTTEPLATGTFMEVALNRPAIA